MQIIKLDATESTNTYLKELATTKILPDFTVVYTQNQFLGRGQLNSVWESEPGKNLAISILKQYGALANDFSFLISICVSLGVLESLREFKIPNLSVKWPNDIMSGTFKIGGILIENKISGTQIKSAVIGFGLNLNQQSFKNAPHAASLKQLVGRTFDVDVILYSLLTALNNHLSKPLVSKKEELFGAYHANLFKLGVPSQFKLQNDQVLVGTIKGIAKNGKLKVEFENGQLQEFGLKEIQLLY